MNYRLLDRGETMQEGDEILASTEDEKWEPIPHWSVGMPYRPSNNSVRRAIDVHLDAESVIERLQARLEHSDYFNGVRFARLWHWAHEELSEEQKKRYFCIVANGTADVLEPPTYARQMNALRHRAERAEEELARQRATPLPLPLTLEDVERLAKRHEAFGFGRVDERGLTTHGFDPEGLLAFVKELLLTAAPDPVDTLGTLDRIALLEGECGRLWKLHEVQEGNEERARQEGRKESDYG